jgi:integrase
LLRKQWVDGELAAGRVPELRLREPASNGPTVNMVAEQWRLSRVDASAGTDATYRVNLNRILPRLGERCIDDLTPTDVAKLVADLWDGGDGLARESLRKTLTTLAMVLDFAGYTGERNAARDRTIVKLPRDDSEEVTPPTAVHVGAVARLLSPAYRLALPWLDWSGARVGSVETTTIGDYDEPLRRVRLRRQTMKQRRALWVELPDALAKAVEQTLPPRDDRDLAAPLFSGVRADALRTAIARACKAAGVPSFSPHDLRHRRISVLHRQGRTWADIGGFVGQRNLAVTANTYTHVLIDGAEVDYKRVLT